MSINVFWGLCFTQFFFVLRIGLFIVLLCLFDGKLFKTKLQQCFNIWGQLEVSLWHHNESRRIFQSRTISPVPLRREALSRRLFSPQRFPWTAYVSSVIKCALISPECCSICYQCSKRGDTCFWGRKCNFGLCFTPLPLVLGQKQVLRASMSRNLNVRWDLEKTPTLP